MKVGLKTFGWHSNLVRALALPLAIGGMWLIPTTADAALTHQYKFSVDTPIGGTFSADNVGGAAGKLKGDTSISNGRLILPGGGLGITGDHVQLDSDAIALWNYSAVSIAVWAAPTTVDLWARYFDFGHRGSPDSTPPNTSPRRSFFATMDAGGTVGPGANSGIRVALSDTTCTTGCVTDEQTATAAHIAPLELHHFVATFDSSTDTMRTYLDGVQIAENTAATKDLLPLDWVPTMADPAERTNYALIGGSLWPDPSFEGYLAQFEIYDHALSQGEIAALATEFPAGEGRSKLFIDRQTGQMAFVREGHALTNVVGYSITSAAGALNTADWNSIAENHDEGGPVDIGYWVKLSSPNSVTDLSEFTFDPTNIDGGVFVGTIPLGNDNTWRKSILEDVQMTIKLGDGSDAKVQVLYTGAPHIRSDFDFDGDIDGQDLLVFLENYNSALSPTTLDAISYSLGDINGDQLINVADWRLFKTDYNAQFAASGGSVVDSRAVPEPTSLALACILFGGVGFFLRRCRRESPF
jgi:hypothetical protein